MRTKAVVVLGLLFLLSSIGCSDKKKRYDRYPEIRDAVSNSLEYWSDYFDYMGERPIVLDVFACLHTIAKKNEDYRRLLDENLSKNNNPPKGPWLRLLSKSYDQVPNLGMFQTQRRIRIFTKSLYCDLIEYGEKDFQEFLTMADNRGEYHDTHQLMGFLFLKENGCYDPEIIDKHVADRAGVILEVQRGATEFSDMYAERIGCLYWAGYGDKVEEQWIRKIQSSQREDFGWPTEEGVPSSHPHATAWALLAMTYFLEGEPFQESYYPVFED